MSVAGGLVLVGRDVSDPAVEALVEPVDPFRGAEFFGRSPLPSRVEVPLDPTPYAACTPCSAPARPSGW